MGTLFSLASPTDPGSSQPEDGTMLSPLLPGDCTARLRAAMDGPGVLFGSKPVIGSVRSHVLRARKRITYRNSWQPRLRAQLEPGPQGTLVRYTLRIHPLVSMIVTFWVGFVVIVGGLLAAASAVKVAHGDSQAWLGVLVPPGMLLFEQVLSKTCIYLAREEGSYLKDFLRTELQAREVVPGIVQTAGGNHA